MLKELLAEIPQGKEEDVQAPAGICSSGVSFLNELMDAPAGTENDIEVNFSVGLEPVIASEREYKCEKVSVKELFGLAKCSPKELQRQAKSVIERQDVPLAISQVADAVIQSGEFLCLDGQLYRFAGVIWERLGTEEQVVRAIRDVLDGDLCDCLSKRQFQELSFKVRTTASIQMTWTDIPRHPHLIACLDGVYDLDCDECRVARAEDYLFSQNNFYADEIGCGAGGQFDAFLDKCSDGNAALRRLILEIIGVTLSGYRPRKFFLFYGEPRTGKSQMADLLALLVGKDSVHGIDTPGGLGERFALGSLIDKKLCVCGDAEDATLSTKAVAVIKQITGGDPVLIEVKYQQPFSAVCEALLLFCSNTKLKFKYDRGLYDRLITVPFYNPIAPGEAVERYSELLFEERGYIVGRALAALRKLRERRFQFTWVEVDGIEDRDSDTPDSQALIAKFGEQVCEFNPESHTLSRDLYEAYCSYCRQNGHFHIGDSAFFRAFSAQHPELERTNLRNGRGYRGVHILLTDDACTTKDDELIC